MKKVYTFLLMVFVLILFLLIVYVFNIARTPLISKLIKFDNDNIIYNVRNISPVKYCCGKTVDTLQYKENNRWVYVNPKEEASYTSTMLCLYGFGRGRYEFKINLKEKYGELKSGEYRIEKVFDREEKGKNHVTYKLYVYFDI